MGDPISLPKLNFKSLLLALLLLQLMQGCVLAEKVSRSLHSQEKNEIGESCPLEPEVTLADLQFEYRNMLATLAATDAPNSAKEMSVERVALLADRLCQKDCKKVLDFLNIVNDHLNAPEFDELVHSFSKRAPVTEQDQRNLERRVFDFRELSNGITSYLSKGKGERFTLRVRAFVELARHLMILNKELVFAIAERKEVGLRERYLDPNSGFQEYIDGFVVQARSLLLLSEVVLKVKADPQFVNSAEGAKLIADAINDLGFFYAKFAQSLSNLTMGIEDDHPLVEQFRLFQESFEPMPFSVVVETFQQEFQKNPEDIFEIPEYNEKKKKFESEPKHFKTVPIAQFFHNRSASGQAGGKLTSEPKSLATATIAQTYRWKLKRMPPLPPRDVVVKVQRPNREEQLASNIELNKVFYKIKDVLVAGEEFAPLVNLVFELLIGFEDSVAKELDFELEAENLEKAYSFLATQKGIQVPRPIWRLTKKRILTMEAIPGVNVDKMTSGRARSFAPGKAAEAFVALLDSVLFQFFGLGPFGLGWMHGDLHPGNNKAESSGALGLLDWANVFETSGLVWQPTRSAWAFFFGNEEMFVDALEKIKRGSQTLRREEFEIFVRAEMDKLELYDISSRSKFALGQKADAIFKRWKQVRRLSGGESLIGKMTVAYAKILSEGVRRFNWLPTDRYANLIRTTVPMVMTQYGLLSKSEQQHVFDLIEERWWRVLIFDWPLRRLYGEVHYRSGKSMRNLFRYVDQKAEAAKEFLQGCTTKLTGSLKRGKRVVEGGK